MQRHVAEDLSVTAQRCLTIEYVELYTSNLVQAAYFYRRAFGFAPVAKPAADTHPDRTSQILRCGRAQVILTTPLQPGPVTAHLSQHGEGIKDIGLRVSDARLTFEAACRAGAAPVRKPEYVKTGSTSKWVAVVQTSSTLQHTLIEDDRECAGPPVPFFPVGESPQIADRGLECIDHIALAVETGSLARHCDFYCNVFGLDVTHRERVVTALSGMNSVVVQNETGTVTFSIVEAIPAARHSQVEEFIEYNNGAGVQHMAFLSRDIVETVKALRAEGIEFLRTPAEYYAAVPSRVGRIDEDLTTLEELGILADRDQYGYLLQIFSKPVQSVPTFFIEIIQRKRARGFGSGNIRALFEALEREQAARGNL